MSDDPLALYTLIKERLPQYTVNGHSINFVKMGSDLGRSRQALHLALCQRGTVSAEVARELIRLSDGRLTAEDILPFIS